MGSGVAAFYYEAQTVSFLFFSVILQIITHMTNMAKEGFEPPTHGV